MPSIVKAIFPVHVRSASQSADLNIPDILKPTIDLIEKNILHMANTLGPHGHFFNRKKKINYNSRNKNLSYCILLQRFIS